jgi:hypothetical protein
MSETVLHLRVPRELADRLDAQRASELRSRSNMAQFLLDEALRRRADELGEFRDAVHP